MRKTEKQEFTRIEVEELISRIINQDSISDIHYEAKIISEEYNMSFKKKEDEPDEEELKDDFKDKDLYDDDDDNNY